MAEVLSMGLSLLLVWHGRDKVWTPTFKGTPEQRFVAAMTHYQGRMGLSDPLLYQMGGKGSAAGWCASVEPLPGFHAVAVHFFEQSDACRRSTPEFWALHESCHLRMAHLSLQRTDKQKHSEVKTCMGWYSAKERR